MVNLNPPRSSAGTPPLTEMAEETIQGDEDAVVFFIAHGKLLYRYPVHNPFTADVGLRSTTTTNTAAATATNNNNTGSSGGGGAATGSSGNANNQASTAAASPTSVASASASSLPPTRPKRPSGSSKPPRGHTGDVESASPLPSASATPASVAALSKAASRVSAAPTGTTTTSASAPADGVDKTANANAKARAVAPSSEAGTGDGEGTAAASSTAAPSSPTEPPPMSRRERRRQKALKKAEAATQGGGGDSSSQARGDVASGSASASPSPPPRSGSTSTRGGGTKVDKKHNTSASTADLTASTMTLDQLSTSASVASPTGSALAATTATTGGVLAKRKRAVHVQDPTAANTVGATVSTMSSSVATGNTTGAAGGSKEIATTSTTSTAAAAAAPAGVAPQRGLRRPTSFANLAAAEKSASAAHAAGADGTASTAPTVTSAASGPSSGDHRSSSGGAGSGAKTGPEGTNSSSNNNNNNGPSSPSPSSPGATTTTTATQQQQQPQQQQETCIGIQTNALLHLLRASLAGCTTIHVANITFLVYPVNAHLQSTAADDATPQDGGAAGRFAQARLLSANASAASAAAMLVVALRRPDSDDGSLARFVQCFINCLCREESRVGYVGEQVKLMEHIAAVWETGGVEAVIAAAPTYSSGASSHASAAASRAKDAKAATTASAAGLGDVSGGSGALPDGEDEDAYYAYLTDPSLLLSAPARQSDGVGGGSGGSTRRTRATSAHGSTEAWDATQSLLTLRAKTLPNVFSLLAADESPVQLCRELTQLTKCVNFWSRLWKAEAAEAGAWGRSADGERGGRALRLAHDATDLRGSQMLSHTARTRWLARCCSILKRPVLSSAPVMPQTWSMAGPLGRATGSYSSAAQNNNNSNNNNNSHNALFAQLMRMSQAAGAATVAPGSGALLSSPSSTSSSSASPPPFVSGVEVNRLLYLSASFLVAGHAGLAPWTQPDDQFASPYARLNPCGLITVYSEEALLSPIMQRAYVEAVGVRAAELLPMSGVAQCLRNLMLPRQVGAFCRSLEEALLRGVEARCESPPQGPTRGPVAHISSAAPPNRLLSAAMGRQSPAPSLDPATNLESYQTGPSNVLLHASAQQLQHRGGRLYGTAVPRAARQGDGGVTTGLSSAAASSMADVTGLDFFAIEVMELLKSNAIIGVEGELFISFTHGDLASVEQVEDSIRHREKQLKRRLASREGESGEVTTGCGLAEVCSASASTTSATRPQETHAHRRSVRWMPASLTMMLLDQAQQQGKTDTCESAEEAQRLAAMSAVVARPEPTAAAAAAAATQSSTASVPPLHVVHCVWGSACPLCAELAGAPSAWTVRPTAEITMAPPLASASVRPTKPHRHARRGLDSASSHGDSCATMPTTTTKTAPPMASTTTAAQSGRLTTAFIELRFPSLDPAVRASCQRRAARWWQAAAHHARATAMSAVASTSGVGSERGVGTPGMSPESTPQYGFRASSTASGAASPLSPRMASTPSMTSLTSAAFQGAARPWFLKPDMYMAPSTLHAVSAVRLYKAKMTPSIRGEVPSGSAAVEDGADVAGHGFSRTRGRNSRASAGAGADGGTTTSAASPLLVVPEGHSSKGGLPAADEDDSHLLLTAESIAADAVDWLCAFSGVAQARLDATRQRRLRLCRSACRRGSEGAVPAVTHAPARRTSGSEAHTTEATTTIAAVEASSAAPVAVAASLPIVAAASLEATTSPTHEPVGSAVVRRETPRCSPTSSPFTRYSKRVLPQRTPPSGVFASQQASLLFVPPQTSRSADTVEGTNSPLSPALELPKAATVQPQAAAAGRHPSLTVTTGATGAAAVQTQHVRVASPLMAVPFTYPGRTLPVEVLLQVVFHHLVAITWGGVDGMELEALVRQTERSLRRLPPLLSGLRQAQQLQLEYGTSEQLAAAVESAADTAVAATTSTATTATMLMPPSRPVLRDKVSLPSSVVTVSSTEAAGATQCGSAPLASTAHITTATAPPSVVGDTSRNSTSVHYALTNASVQLLRAYEVFDALQLLPLLQPYAGCHVQVVPTRLLLHAVVNEFSDVLVPRASGPVADNL